jgi:SAM-dependent methyltransferase
MACLLPAAPYQSPPRPVRGTILNTIIEDQQEGSVGHASNESGTDTDEGTVIYNPIKMNTKGDAVNISGRRPPPFLEESSFAVGECGPDQRRDSFDELYDASDNETEFSNSSSSYIDSLSSRPTSFATDSSRNSVASCRSNTKHRYPAIMIPPSNMWPSLTASTKESSAVPPTPPPKIPVSPAALSLLPRFVPALNAPPSLDGSSMTSEQVSCISAPVTPDMVSLRESEGWDAQHAIRLRRDGDSARDDTESESMSPHGEVVIEQPIDWEEIGNFPRIPGATPQEMSPITPNIQGLGVLRPFSPSDRGVLLPSDALRTLNQLAPDESFDALSESSTGDQAEMQEGFDPVSRPRSADGATPASHISDYSFSQLSIPSPGGFFSSLRTGTRHTWFPGASKQSNPPSSTTAENFYNVPWRGSQMIVEQVLEFADANTDGPPTARQGFTDAPSTARRINTEKSSILESSTHAPSSLPSSVETVRKLVRSPELRYEYEDAYESELMESAAAHLDRTSMWLGAQISYLSALRETNPANNMSETPCPRIDGVHEGKDLVDSPMKKAVRFLEETTRTETDRASQIGQHEEHVYYHAFQHLAHRRRRRDSFVQGTQRFDAVQASRIALTNEHIDQLRGRYEVKEPTRPKYSGPFSQNPRATGVVDYTPTQMVFMEVEREKGVLDQISPTYWVTDALKCLNGGNLLLSEAAKRLAKAETPIDAPNRVGKKGVRALDLGGNSSCDWAWHCARRFPNVQTYTVITPSAATNPSLTGPVNHRLAITPQLWKLPFGDNYFDLISARSLHAMLKHEPIPGNREIDEYDLCLRECYRVLKPGGYLEFMLMDSDMTHAGPLANAMSVEFGFKLKTRGYDPSPTKSFLGRLRKTNFVGVKRAWMFLPAGAPTQDPFMPRETPLPIPPSADGAEAVRGPVGSTADVANVTGLLGSWMWEQWMLKLQMEMGTEKDKLLKGVAPVFEESKNCDAGWRCLSGWARKPKQTSKPKSKPKGKGNEWGRARAPTTETIHIKIEE